MIDDFFTTLNRFFTALNRLEMQPTPEEVADALWLATQMILVTSTPAYDSFAGNGGQAGVEGRPLLAGTEATDPAEKKGGTLSEETTASGQEGAGDSGVPLASGANNMSIGETGSLPIRVPGAQALPQALELSRKLRPLMRRIPSRTRELLDEEATAQRIAEERIWVPVLSPAPARWLEVALVLDTGPSMRVWQQTAQELQLLLERQGAFYDVRVWTMDTSVRDRVVLSNTAGGTARRPRELIDPLGRRLILLVTDYVCPAWYGGAAAQLVNDWARTQPVAIVQMLPQRLWTQTALKEARMVRVHAPYPGAPSGVLKKRTLTRRSKRAFLSDVAVPILTLEPEFVTLWSHLIAGKAGVWAPGVILSAQSLPLPADEPQALSAQQRVEEFQAWASTTAFQLAILLAAAPLRLPIMRLAQKALLPTSKQVHLAEVFSSGLLQRDRQVEATSDPDSIHYDFLPDVRDALLSAGRLMDAVQVQRVVSEYIRERFGQVLDFQAVLLDPARFDQTPLDPKIQPFAMVTADVLRRLGGAYAAAADRWQARVEREKRVAAALGRAASDPIIGATQMVQIGEVRFPQKHPKAHEFYDGKHKGRREIDVPVTFDPPFTRQPKVVVSLQKIDLGDVAANIHRIAVRAEKVSLQGFNLYFETWEDSQIYDAIASWIAVGE